MDWEGLQALAAGNHPDYASTRLQEAAKARIAELKATPALEPAAPVQDAPALTYDAAERRAALELVLELAKQNALDLDACTDEFLAGEQARQKRAFAIVRNEAARRL